MMRSNVGKFFGVTLYTVRIRRLTKPQHVLRPKSLFVIRDYLFIRTTDSAPCIRAHYTNNHLFVQWDHSVARLLRNLLVYNLTKYSLLCRKYNCIIVSYLLSSKKNCFKSHWKLGGRKNCGFPQSAEGYL